MAVITIDPEPPRQGGTVRICITPAQATTFTLEYTGAPDEQHTSDASGCITVTVPDTATALTVSAAGAVAVSTPVQSA